MNKLASGAYASTEYPGVNVGFVVVPGGAVAIDAPTLPADAKAWRRRITETAGGPILYVVVTDGHPDRLLSVGLMKAPVVGSLAAYERAAKLTEGSWRAAAERWIRRFPQAAKALNEPAIALPEIILVSRLMLHRGDQVLSIETVPGAAPGSVWVHLPERNVLFAGDTVVIGTHPPMEATPDTKAWLDTLKGLRRPAHSKTTIVPGRGPISQQAATRPLSDYVALLRRRARSLRGDAQTGMAAAVADLMDAFPVGHNDHDAHEKQVRANLERACRVAEQASN